MNPTLARLIGVFRAAQERAVVTLLQALKLPQPVSNSDWLRVCSECDLHKRKEWNGIRIYAHGYGVELTYPDLSIDFDWGDHGEPDGFDAWRLWNFCETNQLFLEECTYDSIKTWIQDAFVRNELHKDTHLFYLPKAEQSAAVGLRGAEEVSRSGTH